MRSAVAMAAAGGKKRNVVLRCQFNLVVHHWVNPHASFLTKTKEVKDRKGWFVVKLSDSIGTTHRLDYVSLRAWADAGRVSRWLVDSPPRRRLRKLLVA